MDVPDDLPAGQYAVYALVDPTDHLVYYVGQTCNPKRRLVEHLKGWRQEGMKAEWLRSLKQKGQKPLMQLLEIVVDEATALTTEQEWISHFVEQGRSLLNVQTQPRQPREPITPLPREVSGVDDSPLFSGKLPLNLALKMELVAAIYREFYPEQVAEPTPEPEAAPAVGPAGGRSGAAPDSAWDRLFEALHEIRREERARVERLAGRLVMLEERVKSLERRVAGMGQGGAANVGWLPLLSGAHLADLGALLRSLEQATGRTQAQLEQELVETFGVAAINAIPEEQWEDVLAWCWWRARAQQAT